MGNDPSYPTDLEVTDTNAEWSFSSPNLPPALTERRVYFVANAQADSFEIKEFTTDSDTLDHGGDAAPGARIECGWTARLPLASADSTITWKPRTKYDDWIWLLEVSANDIPGHDPATYTIPNIDRLIGQMIEIKPRYLIVTPPISSSPERGVGSVNWRNYHELYIPLVHERYGDRVLDTQRLMSPLRTAEELSFLNDPDKPQLLWISGTPTNKDTWQASPEPFDGASQQWVGPGFTPLQFRTTFVDSIHLGTLSHALLATEINRILELQGW